MNEQSKVRRTQFAFFGTPDRAVIVLNELKNAGFIPDLIITQPDRPQGRNLTLTPPPVKVWAHVEGIRCIQPDNLNSPDFKKELKDGSFDVFVVVAYGNILTSDILNIPRYGSLNLHASLLPLLRGSSPIETAILHDMKETGVTIIKMDEKMDHGPIISQKKISIEPWPLPADDLAKILVTEGGKLLAQLLPLWVLSEAKEIKQDHGRATYAKKIVKEDGHINLSDDGYKNFLKYNAYKGWPGIFFFKDIKGKKVRITVTEASYENGTFNIIKVIPEGKREMLWKDVNAQ